MQIQSVVHSQPIHEEHFEMQPHGVAPADTLGRLKIFSIRSSKFCSFITAFFSILIFLSIGLLKVKQSWVSSKV